MAEQSVSITWHGAAAQRKATAGCLKGLKIYGEYLLGEAVAIVPHDEGTLQDSGKSVVNKADLEVIVAFDTPYAVVQHEDLTLHHANGRQAKYLEKPWLASREKAMKIIQTQIRKALLK